MALALWHFEVFRYHLLLAFVFFLLCMHYTNFAYASYQQVSLPGDNYISPLQLQNEQGVQDTACKYSPDLLDMEISKVNLSTQQEDIFQFYVEMSDLQVEPSHLSYTWVIEFPSGAIVRQQPVLDENEDNRLLLKLDQWGTYSITLILEDSFQNCNYRVYIFQYPAVDHDNAEFIPSIHAEFGDTWMF